MVFSVDHPVYARSIGVQSWTERVQRKIQLRAHDNRDVKFIAVIADNELQYNARR